jgi:hypothetical protein
MTLLHIILINAGRKHNWEVDARGWRCRQCGIAGMVDDEYFKTPVPMWYNDLLLSCDERIIKEIIE